MTVSSNGFSHDNPISTTHALRAANLGRLQLLTKLRNFLVIEGFDGPRSLISDEKREGAAAGVEGVVDRVVQAPGGGNVGADEHIPGAGYRGVTERRIRRRRDFLPSELFFIVGTFASGSFITRFVS